LPEVQIWLVQAQDVMIHLFPAREGKEPALVLVVALSGLEDGSGTPSCTRLNLGLLVRWMVVVVFALGLAAAAAAAVADAVEVVVAAQAYHPSDSVQVRQSHGMAHSFVERRNCVDSLRDRVHEEIEVYSRHWPSQRHASEDSRKD
jgi:hypothetical protein